MHALKPLYCYKGFKQLATAPLQLFHRVYPYDIANCSVVNANDNIALLNTAIWFSHANTFNTANIDQGKYSLVALFDYNLCIFVVIFK